MIDPRVGLRHCEVNDTRIACQACGIVGYSQHIGKNCYRARHYVGFENDKPVFNYHRQDLEYVLRSLEHEGIDEIDQDNVDQNLKVTGFINERLVGPVVQFGMNAAFARRRSRVQIPPGPHLTCLKTAIAHFRIV